MYKHRLHCENTVHTAQNVDKSLEREITLAKNIQSSLLNGKTPNFRGGKVCGNSIPARLIGGDYYDFYPLVNGKIRIVIGDVMGKGIPAAMLMILTRGAFRSAAESTQSPGKTLTSMNYALYDDLRTLKSFVTLFCADWDPNTMTLTYANAGHNLPLYLNQQENTVQEVPVIKGVMVGGLPNQIYKEESITLNEGDTIFFYTDGIVEAENQKGEQYKRHRLVEHLERNIHQEIEELENSVIRSIDEFTDGAPQKDDITMVILKVNNQNTDITSVSSPLIC